MTNLVNSVDIKFKNIIPDAKTVNKFLDTVKSRMHMKSDAQLCRLLSIQPPFLSKMRHSITTPSAAFVVTLIDLGFSLAWIKEQLIKQPSV